MLLAFSVTPIGTASASVSDAVAEAVRVVRDSGLPGGDLRDQTAGRAPIRCRRVAENASSA